MYEALDYLILDAVRRNKSPLCDGEVNREANKIAAETERKSFRVIDGRLQALRRQKRIQWMAKAQAPGGLGGWRLVDN